MQSPVKERKAQNQLHAKGSTALITIDVREAFYWGGGKKFDLKIAIFPENNNFP